MALHAARNPVRGGSMVHSSAAHMPPAGLKYEGAAAPSYASMEGREFIDGLKRGRLAQDTCYTGSESGRTCNFPGFEKEIDNFYVKTL